MQLLCVDATVGEKQNQCRFLFLGTATSVGVPVIGCSCETCLSDHPGNTRTRSSVFLEGPWGKILVDSGPDLREQALREGLSALDAVLYTHEHVDHVAGFDELRAFCWHRTSPLPIYATPETLSTLGRMYPWAFKLEDYLPGYVRPAPHPIEGPFELNGLKITPINVTHGTVRTCGFRFDHPSLGSLAYLPDVKTICHDGWEHLDNLDTLVIDGLRPEEHPTHLSISEALAIIAQVSPRQSYLTHLSHEINWPQTNASLPANVSLAHDGLNLSFPPL